MYQRWLWWPSWQTHGVSGIHVRLHWNQLFIIILLSSDIYRSGCSVSYLQVNMLRRWLLQDTDAEIPFLFPSFNSEMMSFVVNGYCLPWLFITCTAYPVTKVSVISFLTCVCLQVLDFRVHLVWFSWWLSCQTRGELRNHKWKGKQFCMRMHNGQIKAACFFHARVS